MLNKNFENKIMSPNDHETKDLVEIDGERMSRHQAKTLREELSKQLTGVTDPDESRRLTGRISELDRALRQ